METIQDKIGFFYETVSLLPSASAFEKHMHNEYELYYFLQGDADYIVGDTVYHLQKNNLLLIRPAVYHCLRLRSAAPYRRIVVNFTADQLSQPFASELDGYATYYRIPSGGVVETLYRHAVGIAERYSPEDAAPCMLQYLNLIVAELKYSQTGADEPPVSHSSPLGKILRYIDENLSHPLSINSIASEFYLSPSWLTHEFRKHMNISLMQYINRKKILTAEQHIQKGVPPMEAAERCGFKNYSTFYLQYKNILGVNPAKTKSE